MIALEPLHRVGLDEQHRQIVALELEVRHGRVDELVGIDDRLDLRARQLARRSARFAAVLLLLCPWLRFFRVCASATTAAR